MLWNNKFQKICFVLFVFIFGISFSIAWSEKQRSALEEWMFPPIDYQNVREGTTIDPRMKTALEEMRKVLGKTKDTLLKHWPDNSAPIYYQYQQKFHYWQSCTVQFVALLREAGLDVSAEKMLDTYPDNASEFRSRLSVLDMKQKKVTNPDGDRLLYIINLLQQKIDDHSITFPITSGKTRYRRFSGLNALSSIVLSDEPTPAETPRSFKTYKEWTTALLEEYPVEKQDVLNKLKILSDRNSYPSGTELIPYALLLSAMGFQTEAIQTIQKTKEAAQNYIQKQLQQDRYKLKKNLIRSTHTWNQIIAAYILIGEYQSAIKMLEECKETFIELYVASESHSS
ncbi:MAG: hypothetical protein LBF88_10775, partial [Planctomycetaceae bacterium]|nr:hypothetical protein [Planctomycetaceae bacterium]